MDTRQILEKWHRRSKSIQDCHYDAASGLKSWHYSTGVPLVILSALAASNILAELVGIFPLFPPYSKLIAAVIGLAVTVLAAVQAFMGFEKRSELHYKAGVKYGAIKREIELLDESKVDQAVLEKLKADWNALTEESPIIPRKIWRANQKKKEAAGTGKHGGGR